MRNSRIFLVLLATEVADGGQRTAQNNALIILDARKIPYEIADGSDPDQFERREELFTISGVRGKYPQFFFAYTNGLVTFFGNFEKLQDLNETNDLTDEYLEENPDVETWNKVMFEDDDESTFVAMQSQALLVGNEHSQIDENRHQVTLFVREAPDNEFESNPLDLGSILLVRFGFRSTLSCPENSVAIPPFEQKLRLYGHFNVPIAIEFKDSTIEPVLADHNISFDEPKSESVIVFDVRSHSSDCSARKSVLIPSVKLGDLTMVQSVMKDRKNRPSEKETREASVMAIIENRETILGVLLGLNTIEHPSGPSDARLWKALKYYSSQRRQRDTKPGDLKELQRRCCVSIRSAIVNGASPLARDSQGKLPCHFAAHENAVQILIALQKVDGLNPSCDTNGHNALHHAARTGATGALKWLLTQDSLSPATMLRKQSCGSYGPGLTPYLLGKASTRDHYPERHERTMEIFGEYLVSWEIIEHVLLIDDLDLNSRLDALRALRVECQNKGWCGVDDGLYFYDYLAKDVIEGEGITTWHNDRASLLFERLISPLFTVLSEGNSMKIHREILKSLSPLAGIPAKVESTTLGLALERSANQTMNILRKYLDEAQDELVLVPESSEPGEVLHKLPPGMTKPHLSFCHPSMDWIFASGNGDYFPDVKSIFFDLKSAGIVDGATSFIKFVNEEVLPTIDWTVHNDSRPSVNEGTASVAKFTQPVMKTVCAALRICAYDALLVSWGTRMNQSFQNQFQIWMEQFCEDNDILQIRAGPLKTLERVRIKKFDYVSKCPHWVNKSTDAPKEGQQDPDSIALCAALVDCPICNEEHSNTWLLNPLSAGNICDISRLSVEFASEVSLVVVFEKLLETTLEKDGMQVLRYNNGHHEKTKSPSGYRDVKLLIMARAGGASNDSEGCEMHDVFIHECQLIINVWLAAKKNMHVCYKFVR